MSSTTPETRPETQPQETRDPQDRILELERALEESRRQAAAVADNLALQRAVAAARAADAEIVEVLARRLLDDGAARTPEDAVREIRRRRPHLFTGAATPIRPTATAPAEPAAGAASARTEELARRAAATGDRHDLLSYLRARRAEAI